MASEKPVDKLIDTVEPFYTKDAPFQMPEDVTRSIADWSWLVALVIGIMSLPTILAVVSVNTFVGTVGPALGASVSPLYWVGVVLLAAQAVLFFLSVPGLKMKSYSKGWMFLFYAFLLSLATSLVFLLAGDVGSLFGAILTTLVGFYLLFQIKHHFLPVKSAPAMNIPAPDKPVAGTESSNDKLPVGDSPKASADNSKDEAGTENSETPKSSDKS